MRNVRWVKLFELNKSLEIHRDWKEIKPRKKKVFADSLIKAHISMENNMCHRDWKEIKPRKKKVFADSLIRAHISMENNMCHRDMRCQGIFYSTLDDEVVEVVVPQ